MADGKKANELPECPAEGGATTIVHDSPTSLEVPSSSSPTCEEQSPSRLLPPGLLSMPCLLKELRRDSSPEPLPSETGPAPSVIQLCPQEDSDSSACLRSPSSSGHLGDSDTLSSAEEDDVKLAKADVAPSAHSASAPRKSSRRSRSESEASAGIAMAAKKNRCQEKQTNGGRSRGRGQRSQRQKERMRLLRQKREAVAKRNPRPLQDSSTSDSDVTARSSSSSASSDNEGETVNLHTPAGRCGNAIGGVLEEALTRVVAVQRRTEERFRAWMERISRLHSDEDDNQSFGGNAERPSHINSQEPQTAYRIMQCNDDATPTTLKSAHMGPAVIGHYDLTDTNSEQEQRDLKHSVPVEVEPPQVSLALSDSEVEIVGVQENTSAVSRFPRGGVIQSLSSWKQSTMPTWTAVSAQSDWAPPPEVVDLTLDEDRHKYLL